MTDQKLVREDLLQMAADYADFCVLITESALEFPGPKVLYVNPAWTRMTGFSTHEIIGQTPRILQGPATDTKMLGRLRSTLESGKDFIARTTNYRRNGEAFELEWIISHLKDHTGKTTHYIALQRDITGKERARHELERFDEELVAAQSQLIQSTKQLESVEASLAEKARFAAMGEITAGVVHDLSNALTPVFGLVELLHSMDSLPEDARKAAKDLDICIEHALNMLTNLRNYHTAGASKKPEPVVLRNLIRQLPDLTKGKWADINRPPNAGINFAFDLQGEATVLGVESEILQVLVNLVLNAVDAMPEGGTISIATRVDAEKAILTVADTGIGMSDELAAKCFEPYVKGRSDGTGLGLSVCRRIIESHEGTIVAIPSSGQGVSFQIELPLAFADTI